MASKKKRLNWSWPTITLIAVSIIFFAGSLLLINQSNLYISPDETANAYFATQFAETGLMQGRTNELSAVLEDRIHPRSIVSVEGTLLPGSFLGLTVLYGMVASILGSDVLPFITPLLTIFAAFGFSLVVKRYTNPTIGWLSFILFLAHPAIWYYSARGLMHNVLFIDLMVIAAWMWLEQPLRKEKRTQSLLNDGLVGFLIALAIFVRTSEIAWVFVTIAAVIAVFWKAAGNKRLRVATIGTIAGGGVALLANWLTYGHPFLTGYTVGAVAQEATVITDSVATTGVLPFGFHPRTALQHFADYGVTMFWWLSILAAPGLFILWTQKRHQRTVRWGIGIAAVVSIWIVLMYGSWEIHDNPDPTQVTMANSYVRYWLPMYIASIPMIAATLQWVSERAKTTMAKGLFLATLLVVVLGLNVHATFIQGQDGLIKVRQELIESAAVQESVLAYVPENAVIIVDRADKLFFPHRDVWYPLRDDATYEAMPTLATNAPLFYYGITFPETDMEYLNGTKLAELGLEITLIETYDIESLYVITIK